MGGVSHVPKTPQRNWSNIPDPMRAMPVKVSVKDGKISNVIKTSKPKAKLKRNLS